VFRIRPSMWECSVELGAPDRWVLTSLPRWRIGHWLESGLTRVPEEKLSLSIHAALARVRDQDVATLWQQLFDYCVGPAPTSVDELAHALLDAACGPLPRVIVLERLIERGFRAEPLVWKPRPLPPRTQTDHFVVVQALDPEERPVAGLQLEVLIADGEIRAMQTDAEGFARVDRVQAGRVVIRVLGVDGKRWRALEEPAAQPSGSSTGLRWHVVRQGECLSRIAHRYGFESWKDLWNDPKNEALRKRRKSPHVLHPGDEVAVPAVNVYEITRPTDATHRIEVEPQHLELVLRLADHHGRPYRSQPFELRLTSDPGAKPAASGTTDGEGMLREKVPTSAQQIYVSLPEQELCWPVAVSTLPGLPERAGEAFETDQRPNEDAVKALQLRLNALGIASGPVDGVWNAPTQLAVLKLRRSRGRTGAEPLQDADLQDLASFGV
jgi:hypothetical protein